MLMLFQFLPSCLATAVLRRASDVEERGKGRKGEREKGRKGEREKGRKGEREKGEKDEREKGASERRFVSALDSRLWYPMPRITVGTAACAHCALVGQRARK